MSMADGKEKRPVPMLVTSGPVVRERGEKGPEKSVEKLERGRPLRRPAPIVDPRTGQAANVARIHPQGSTLRSNVDSDPPKRAMHRRSSSWDGRKTSPPRSPSPSVNGHPRVSSMTDEQLYQYVISRTARNSPSPGRTVKYTRKAPPQSPTLATRSPPTGQKTYLSSQRTSSAKKLLERELDEFCDELAQIHQINSSIDQKISEMQVSADGEEKLRDGCKPGNVKQIAISPQERFKSPKHSISIESVLKPPSGIIKPSPRQGYNVLIDTEKSAYFR